MNAPITAPSRLEEEGTGDAADKLVAVRERFATRWLRALDTFHATDGQIAEALAKGEVATEAAIAARGQATAALLTEWHGAIDEAWEQAYSQGRQIWGAVGPHDRDALRAAIAQQKGYASKFALELAQGQAGALGRMTVGNRTALYLEGTESAYQRGAVAGMPDGVLILWRMGAAEHCGDCPVLAANSPYTRETLPTVPRGGATKCQSRCFCSLDFREASKPAQSAPVDARSLTDRILGEPPPAPPGLRAPTEEERRVLWDVETRLNHARRSAEAANTAGRYTERDRHLALRSKLNARLIEFTQARSIHHVPSFSVGEVIRGADVLAGDVDNLVRMRGIDGTSVSRASARAVREALDAAHQDLGAILGSYPASVPAVPDLQALLRAAGAPPSAFGGDLARAGEALDEAPAAERIPSPEGVVVYNLIGRGAGASLRAHLLAAGVLAGYAVELGPFDDDWMTLVAAAGTWVRGEGAAVDGFLDAAMHKARRFGWTAARWLPAVA